MADLPIITIPVLPVGVPDRRSYVTERRRHGSQPNRGRRWQDDPYIRAAVEHAMLPFGAEMSELRMRLQWSVERVAYLAGLHHDTISAIENFRGDPQVSSLIRHALVFGRALPLRSRVVPGVPPVITSQIP